MLEELARPWSSPSPLNQTVVVSQTQRVPMQRARVNWGTVGTLPAASTGGGFKVLDCDDKYKQTSGKLGKAVRIENPDDSSQYVMVAPFETVSFSHQAKDEITISYQKTQKLYGPITLSGSTASYVNVIAPKDTTCKTEYDLLPPDSIAGSETTSFLT